MAITSEIVANEYDGNASTSTPYTINFAFFDEGDVYISLKDTLTESTFGDPIAQSLYTVTPTAAPAAGLPHPGGTLVTSTAYPATTELKIFREMDLVQPTVYADEGPFPAKVHEGALDRQVMMMQQLWSNLLLALDETNPNIIIAPDNGAAFQQTRVFDDTADRGTKTPEFIGQLGLQKDDFTVWRGSSLAAGGWTEINMATATLVDNADGSETLTIDGNSDIIYGPLGTFEGALPASATWKAEEGAGSVNFTMVNDSTDLDPSNGMYLLLGFTDGDKNYVLQPLKKALFTGTDPDDDAEVDNDAVEGYWTMVYDADDYVLGICEPGASPTVYRTNKPAYQYNHLLVTPYGDDTNAALAHNGGSPKKSWDHSTPFLTLAAAVTSAEAGATITVAPGTYTGVSTAMDISGMTVILDNAYLVGGNNQIFASAAPTSGDITNIIGRGYAGLAGGTERIISFTGLDGGEFNMDGVFIDGAGATESTTKVGVWLEGTPAAVNIRDCEFEAAVVLQAESATTGTMTARCKGNRFNEGVRLGVLPATVSASLTFDYQSAGDRYGARNSDNNVGAGTDGAIF